MLVDAITQETPISIGVLLGVGGLVLTSAVLAIVAAVTTRVSNQKDIAALQQAVAGVIVRVEKQEAWQGKAQTKIALVHDRQARASGTGSYKITAEDE